MSSPSSDSQAGQGSAKAPHPRTVWGALLMVQLLFGINYSVSKVVVTAVPPLLWADVRAFLGSFILFGIAKLWGGPAPKLNREFFVPLLGFALLGTTLNAALFLSGLSRTTSINGAVLNMTIPMLTLLWVVIRGIEKLTTSKAVGFLSAFSGVLILVGVEKFSLSNETALGDLLILLNCLSFSLFLAFSKSFIEKYHPFWITAWMFLIAGFGLSIPAYLELQTWTVPVWTPGLLGCLAFALLGATVGTYVLNNWALAHTQASRVALLIYLQPLLAAALGAIWLGESLTWRTGVGGFLISFGLFATIWTKELRASLRAKREKHLSKAA